MKRRPRVLLAGALLVAACDDITGPTNRSDAAPRGTFHSGVNGMSASGAPERGELERLRLDNRSQRPAPPPVPSGATSASAASRDPQIDPLTGRPTALGAP
jgi:hypothetical protein